MATFACILPAPSIRRNRQISILNVNHSGNFLLSNNSDLLYDISKVSSYGIHGILHINAYGELFKCSFHYNWFWMSSWLSVNEHKHIRLKSAKERCTIRLLKDGPAYRPWHETLTSGCFYNFVDNLCNHKINCCSTLRKIEINNISDCR